MSNPDGAMKAVERYFSDDHNLNSDGTQSAFEIWHWTTSDESTDLFDFADDLANLANDGLINLQGGTELGPQDTESMMISPS